MLIAAPSVQSVQTQIESVLQKLYIDMSCWLKDSHCKYWQRTTTKKLLTRMFGLEVKKFPKTPTVDKFSRGDDIDERLEIG